MNLIKNTAAISVKCFVFLLSCMVLFNSCSSTKKTGGGDQPAAAKQADANPTLKKGNYTWLDKETFLLQGLSEDKSYGYSMNNAIKVGMADNGNSGPSNERSYLNALLGPDGQPVTYKRLGGCCPVESKNGFMGQAMLDRYEVTYAGLEKPLILYINMYDPGKLYAPVGFTYKKK